MNRKHFIAYFKKKSQAEVETDDEIQVTRYLSPATENVSEAELTFAEEELNKYYSRPHRYSQRIYQTALKLKLADMLWILEQHQLLKSTPSSILTKYTFNRTTVNSWKSRYKENEKTVGDRPIST